MTSPYLERPLRSEAEAMTEGKDHKIVSSPCPHCAATMDGAYNPFGEERPSPGDITVCIKCQTVLAFDDALCLRMPTDDELAEMAGDPRFKQVLAAIAEVKRPKDIEATP